MRRHSARPRRRYGTPPRTAEVTRNTKETRIKLALNLDGQGQASFATGLPFFEHMLTQVAHHGLIDLRIQAKGDLEVDAHHTVEGHRHRLRPSLRHGHWRQGGRRSLRATPMCPWTRALSRAVLDLSGRPGLIYECAFVRPRIGDFDVDLLREFFQGFVNHAQVTLHLDNLRGGNAHHQAETLFKAFGASAADGGGRTTPASAIGRLPAKVCSSRILHQATCPKLKCSFPSTSVRECLGCNMQVSSPCC